MCSIKLIFVCFLLSTGTIRAAAGDKFIQVEGAVLGYFPSLADGIHVTLNDEKSRMSFTPGHRCFEQIQSEPNRLVANSVNFASEDRQSVHNKLAGLIREIPEGDAWLKTSKGLASRFYRENLAQDPPGEILQLLFVPMILSPEPVSVVKVAWTEQARKILEREGWAGVEQFCGSHFVETVGEEAFVIYSIHVTFPSQDERIRFERIWSGSQQSPVLLLNNLFRMNQRFEFYGPGRAVTVDILQVGGRRRDVQELRDRLVEVGSPYEEEGGALTRTRIRCDSSHIQSCQRTAQAYLDFQFGRLNFSGQRPSFTPVRFRIAPIQYISRLMASNN